MAGQGRAHRAPGPGSSFSPCELGLQKDIQCDPSLASTKVLVPPKFLGGGQVNPKLGCKMPATVHSVPTDRSASCQGRKGLLIEAFGKS